MKDHRRFRWIGVLAPAFVGAAAALSCSQASAVEVGFLYIKASLEVGVDDPVVMNGRTYYRTVYVIVDPPATDVTSFDLSLEHASWLSFDAAKSGPYGVFSVGGDSPTPAPGVGTQPLGVLPATGKSPGAPLPGSSLNFTDSAGVLNVHYDLGGPVSAPGDQDLFLLDFDLATPLPIDLSKSSATYLTSGTGNAFNQLSFGCTTTDSVDMCGSPESATGVSLSLAVPEPETWALMIAGVGLVGLTLRRRRAAMAVA